MAAGRSTRRSSRVLALASSTVALLACALVVVPRAASGPAAAQLRLAAYLARGEHVAPTGRAVPVTTAVARAAMVALLRGPTQAERRSGLATAIPAGTTLRGIAIRNGVATVDLSARFAAGGGSVSMQLRVAQVVFTLTQFPSVTKVAFALDGRPVTAIGGEGVIVSPPVGRAAFEAQAPPILVEHPLPGDSVGGSPLVVSGTANVFEARFVVELRTTSGRVLVRRNVSASSGTGTRGRFRTTLAVPPTAPAHLLVVAYARSAKDGSPIDVVRVAVVRGTAAAKA
jgi:germination protein M